MVSSALTYRKVVAFAECEWCYLIFLLFLVELKLYGATTYFCPSPSKLVNITGVSTGTINSNRNGETNYGINRDCSWVIDAGDGNRVQLKVTSQHLEWIPSSGICGGYDYMQINDGSSGDTTVIVNICGDRNPFYVISSGRYIFLRFRSNGNSIANYRGIKLDFQVFSKTNCPPTWHKPPSSNSCYMLLNQKKLWEKAQDNCNIMQSNLVVIENEKENNYLKEYMQQNNIAAVWTALTDTEKEGGYKWFGKLPLNSYNGLPSTTSSEYDCVTLLKNGKWVEKHCSRTTDTYPFICQMNKGFPTELMNVRNLVPETEMQAGSPVNPIFIIIGIVIAIIILAIGVGVFLYFYKKRNENKRDEVDSQITPTAPPQSPSRSTILNRPATELTIVRSRDGGPASDVVIRDPASSNLILPPPYEEAIRSDSERRKPYHQATGV